MILRGRRGRAGLQVCCTPATRKKGASVLAKCSDVSTGSEHFPEPEARQSRGPGRALHASPHNFKPGGPFRPETLRWSDQSEGVSVSAAPPPPAARGRLRLH
ncbi:hypothetical protein E2C01_011472 [Portunus trituberculatus]|uniref:Uncharacterized protein n=1 Tax=Portunus trituberculatus TaxID=210409 RepID=A0A5B7DC03_PORTR|nr:hypothetical protein [Portunus trituberculatus]